jgi:hypothetical protein
MRSRAGRSQFPTDCISHIVLLVGTKKRCSGSLEVEDGDDMWAHFVSERNELFSFMIFILFLPLTRSRVKSRPGLHNSECQFQCFKIQGLI